MGYSGIVVLIEYISSLNMLEKNDKNHASSSQVGLNEEDVHDELSISRIYQLVGFVVLYLSTSQIYPQVRLNEEDTFGFYS